MEVSELTPCKKSTNWDYCAVKNCGNRANINSDLSYHRFPRPNERFVNRQNLFGNSEKIDLFKVWKDALQINNITKRTTVCSLHFKKTDYLFPDIPVKKKSLKKNAVPSCNLPGSEMEKMKEEKNKARLERQQKRSSTSQPVNDPSVNELSTESIKKQCNEVQLSTEQKNDDSDQNVSGNSCQQTDNFINIKELERCKHPSQTSKLYKQSHEAVITVLDTLNSTCPVFKVVGVKPNPSITVQDAKVQFDRWPTFLENIKNDSQLRTATGLESFEILHTIVKCVKLISGDEFEKDEVKMKLIDRVVMTFVKLKQNLSYDFLAVLFDCISEVSCEQIFIETIHLLRKCLNIAIPWPSKNEIFQNSPKSSEDFQKFRISLDCVEMKIERSHNHYNQVITNSDHKDIQSCKFLVGVTPRGNISFVSKAHDGKSSESNIFEQSELIKLIESGDSIMVNEGFPIDEICEKNQWKLIRPPFLKGKKNLSKEESIRTARIVHVERLNRQKKFFKILGNTIPVELLSIIDDIFYVICAVFNLSFPTIRNKL